jgi:hypothetical protein
MVWLTSIDYGCPAFTTSGGVMIYDACNSGFSTGIEIVTIIDNIYSQRAISTYTYTGVSYQTWWQIAWPIQIRWKAQDLSLTTSSPLPNTQVTISVPSFTTSTISSSSVPTSLSSFTPTSTSPSPTDILNVGAEVGSIVGAIVGFAAVVATIYYGHNQIKSQGMKRVREQEQQQQQQQPEQQEEQPEQQQEQPEQQEQEQKQEQEGQSLLEGEPGPAV